MVPVLNSKPGFQSLQLPASGAEFAVVGGQLPNPVHRLGWNLARGQPQILA
jgi:hypothetical protein